MKLSFNFTIGRYTPYFSIRTGVLPKPRKRTAGICNITKDAKFVVFLDYDNKKYEIVKLDCQALQFKFGLSDIHIIECGEDTFHGICYDKFTMRELLEVLSYALVDKLQNGSKE